MWRTSWRAGQLLLSLLSVQPNLSWVHHQWSSLWPRSEIAKALSFAFYIVDWRPPHTTNLQNWRNVAARWAIGTQKTWNLRLRDSQQTADIKSLLRAETENRRERARVVARPRSVVCVNDQRSWSSCQVGKRQTRKLDLKGFRVGTSCVSLGHCSSRSVFHIKFRYYSVDLHHEL